MVWVGCRLGDSRSFERFPIPRTSMVGQYVMYSIMLCILKTGKDSD